MVLQLVLVLGIVSELVIVDVRGDVIKSCEIECCSSDRFFLGLEIGCEIGKG